MHKRVYIYAYTQLNLGDDLFVKILCDRYPDVNFVMMCNRKFSESFSTISNLTVIPFIPKLDGLFNLLNINVSINGLSQRIASSFCHAIVNIGGSIFIESEVWEFDIHKYKSRLLNSKPYYIIGSNFGPYRNINYLNGYKKIFNSVKDVCFRDIYSYRLFSDLPNVRYASDVVFSYPATQLPSIKKQISISIIDLFNRSNLKEFSDVYINKIVELSCYFIKMGYSVYLLGFCEIEGDNEAILNIVSRISKEEKKFVFTHFYSGELNVTMQVIQESQYVIASRFHAMILGWVFQKPVFPIVYSDKSLHVMKDVGFNGLYSKIEDIENVKVKDIFSYFLNANPLNIEECIKSANLQFQKLDEFLREDK